MGGVCSAGLTNRGTVNLINGSKNVAKIKRIKSSREETKDDFSFSDENVYETTQSKVDFCELSISCELKSQPPPSRTSSSKVPHMSSILGRARIVGLERAVEVLDTLGSSMSNLNASTGFVSGMTSRKNKMSILAFEVANTIVKGANLLQSLSKESIQFLKKEILLSDGVQRLVSTDMEELLRIAAADKREEWDVFSREVFRFGNLCKDPQWHNLGRCFQKLDSDTTTHRQIKEEVEMTIQELATLALNTAELYHELHALDRFEQDYRQKVEELESLHLTQGGENLMILQSELKHQRKLVRSLEKKSLWSKNLEEIMGKLVDIVTFIYEEIMEAFGNSGTTLISKDPIHKSQKLGVCGLALHYASIISQIDSIVSRRSSLPPNARDTLYHALPPGVKAALRTRLQSFQAKEELTASQIKDEMEKTLRWLVPVAVNTAKAHKSFGWVGEWANTSSEFKKKTSAPNNLLRLQTLYHADREKTELHILEVVTWLHRLISQVRSRDYGFKPLFPGRSPTHNVLFLRSKTQQGSLPMYNNGKINGEASLLRPETSRSSSPVPYNGKSNGLLRPETSRSSSPVPYNGESNGRALLLQPEIHESLSQKHNNGKINGESLVLRPKSHQSSSAGNNDRKTNSKVLFQNLQAETQQYLSPLHDDGKTNIKKSQPQPENQQDSSPLTSSSKINSKTSKKVSKLSQEDREMLERIKWRRLVPRRSKSLEFSVGKKGGKQSLRLSRSTGNSPMSSVHLKTLTVP
ncbi:protein PSK SIMULATOR 2-like [Macadamia integrifolia]|uniref:protein PSK SIMULATOR 2-like n=1 Tax=Macadamia integrifolia TaxID=60698 RepID=UPI001C4E4CDF|nr:protein PSK SIMULATOR 2-like [Macadamia integrifolia]XP_042494004.1 protein PSK SIMULATOR 2-like [Macadamia integrifolia]